MKRVSVELFFTVLWRGVCQALEWFFGLFGYKHDGKYAKIVWGVFATSATILISLYAFVIVTTFCEKMYDEYYKEAHPFLYKNKALIPAFLVYRAAKAIWYGRESIKKEISAVRSTAG